MREIHKRFNVADHLTTEYKRTKRMNPACLGRSSIKKQSTGKWNSKL